MAKYFDMIVVDNFYKTVWEIYNLDNSRYPVGNVGAIENYDDGTIEYSYSDYENDLYEHCKSLQEAFGHFGITKWDKGLY